MNCQEFSLWYAQLNSQIQDFKFSFKFLDQISEKIRNNDVENHTFNEWGKNIGQLKYIKNEIIKILENNLHREIKYDSNLYLINVKKDLVKWIREDKQLLNQIDVEYIIDNDDNGNIIKKVKIFDEYVDEYQNVHYKRKPFVINDKKREEVEYRLYLNVTYLDVFLDYLSKFTQLDINICECNTEQLMNDPKIKIIQDCWFP